MAPRVLGNVSQAHTTPSAYINTKNNPLRVIGNVSRRMPFTSLLYIMLMQLVSQFGCKINLFSAISFYFNLHYSSFFHLQRPERAVSSQPRVTPWVKRYTTNCRPERAKANTYNAFALSGRRCARLSYPGCYPGLIALTPSGLWVCYILMIGVR